MSSIELDIEHFLKQVNEHHSKANSRTLSVAQIIAQRMRELGSTRNVAIAQRDFANQAMNHRTVGRAIARLIDSRLLEKHDLKKRGHAYTYSLPPAPDVLSCTTVPLIDTPIISGALVQLNELGIGSQPVIDMCVALRNTDAISHLWQADAGLAMDDGEALDLGESALRIIAVLFYNDGADARTTARLSSISIEACRAKLCVLGDLGIINARKHGRLTRYALVDDWYDILGAVAPKSVAHDRSADLAEQHATERALYHNNDPATEIRLQTADDINDLLDLFYTAVMRSPDTNLSSHCEAALTVAAQMHRRGTTNDVDVLACGYKSQLTELVEHGLLITDNSGRYSINVQECLTIVAGLPGWRSWIRGYARLTQHRHTQWRDGGDYSPYIAYCEAEYSARRAEHDTREQAPAAESLVWIVQPAASYEAPAAYPVEVPVAAYV